MFTTRMWCHASVRCKCLIKHLLTKHHLANGDRWGHHHYLTVSSMNAQFSRRFLSHHSLCPINVWCDFNSSKHRRWHDKLASHIKHIIFPQGIRFPSAGERTRAAAISHMLHFLCVCRAWIKQQAMKYWFRHSEELQWDELIFIYSNCCQSQQLNM